MMIQSRKPFGSVPFRALLVVAFVLALATAGIAEAQTTVALPDTSQSTTLTASVSEQATVTVPAGVSFDVTDVAGSTAASAASVTVSNIVLASSTKQLRVSVQAGATAFTPPEVGATTWNASDVTWNAATWTNGTGASGTLSDSAYTEVVTCTADVASCSTTGLVFTLGANSSVQRAGDHTLTVSWRFESIGA